MGKDYTAKMGKNPMNCPYCGKPKHALVNSATYGKICEACLRKKNKKAAKKAAMEADNHPASSTS